MPTKKTTKKPAVAPKKRLTKAEKRVAIAKDVIAQLKAGKYVAEPGTYCSVSDDDAASLTGGAELQKELKKISQCNVCALGSLFVSDVRKNDKFKVKDAGIGPIAYAEDDFLEGGMGTYTETNVDEGSMRARLGKIFNEHQLALIECAFEGFDVGYDLVDVFVDTEGDFAAKDFYNEYGDATERMIAIMRNIVKNKGTFVPTAAK